MPFPQPGSRQGGCWRSTSEVLVEWCSLPTGRVEHSGLLMYGAPTGRVLPTGRVEHCGGVYAVPVSVSCTLFKEYTGDDLHHPCPVTFALVAFPRSLNRLCRVTQDR